MKLRQDHKFLVWIWIWAITRFVIVAQVGFWNNVHGLELQDILSYENWAHILSTGHVLPTETSWQYPPGAAYVMLLPLIGGGNYGISFVVTMLVFDLVGLGLVGLLCRRGGRDWGIWVWLLGMPILSLLSVARFDLVPTVIAIAALVVIRVRPVWFGALAGLGASVKVWPIFVLFGEWDRRRLLRSVVAAVATLALIFLVSQIAFGKQTGFLTNQGDRGLEVESIAATPWRIREDVAGTPTPIALRFGTIEIGSDLADAVGKALDGVALLALIGAAVWWWFRDRAIRSGRTDLEDDDLARDFVFTILLLFTVTSRVLSPQYMVWMVGLSAVVLSSTRTRLLRPALMTLTAVCLTSSLGELTLILRNVALLAAAVDATWTMVSVLRDRVADQPRLARVQTSVAQPRGAVSETAARRE